MATLLKTPLRTIMNARQSDSPAIAEQEVSRRRFLKTSAAGATAGTLVNLIWLDDAVAAIPAAEGYLLVDAKKCQGCVSCMLACSLVHEGKESLSLARIQVIQNSLSKWPDDVAIEQWVGGHGMGSAIFFDLVKDKTIDGFDAANVVTMMTSPLSGTLVPAGAGRTEVQGIGVQSYPIGWFTRSNFGGRFSTMLKMAGWDGIVLEGKADTPVWLDIRDGPSQFGDDLAEGCIRAAKRWGRLEEDLQTGQLPFPHWGIPVHRDPRSQLEWGYGTILGDRDINEHDFDWLHWQPTNARLAGRPMEIDAEEAVGIYTKKMVPFQDDPLMLDYSTENMYLQLPLFNLLPGNCCESSYPKRDKARCFRRSPFPQRCAAPTRTKAGRRLNIRLPSANNAVPVLYY